MTNLSATNVPSISVVITTYNYGRFIGAALDSVFAQTLLPDEIVVVDDGSTDDTAEIVAAYMHRGVRYVRQENKGAGAARNRGIAETTGEVLGFLDADDIWFPEKLAHQCAYLDAHPDVVLVSGQKMWWDVVTGQRWIEQIPANSEKRLRREILLQNFVGNPSMVMVRRSVLTLSGMYDPTLRWGQDWEFFIRVAQQGLIAWLPEPVIIYRWHPDNLTRNRKWERLSVIHGIARRAIRQYAPWWARPYLLARAWSAIEFDRTRIAMMNDFPRMRTIGHAWRALCSYPFEGFHEKTLFAGRALIGESMYQRLRQIVPQSVRRK